MQILISILSSFFLAIIAGAVVYKKEVEREKFLLNLQDKIKSGDMDKEMQTFLAEKVEKLSSEVGDVKASVLLLKTNSVSKLEMQDMFAEFKSELLITLSENRKDILHLKWSKAVLTFFLILLLNAGVTMGIFQIQERIKSSNTYTEKVD